MTTSTRPRSFRRHALLATAGVVALGAGLITAAVPATAAPAVPGLGAGAPAGSTFAACAAPTAGHAACLARAVAPARGAGAADTTIPGLQPADIASAYGLTGGVAGTVAIVDAFDNPNAEADLAVYRAQWGLPACTSADGCFRKVNQRGAAAPLPPGDPGWGLEIALDLDAASAACPACSLLLVEGDDNSLKSLGLAVNTAVALGADAVSNSYGTDEFRRMTAFATAYYNHPGVPILASTGDFGFTTASFPAVTPTVIAVGGTSLVPAESTRGWSERVWRGAGSGCSAYVAKPNFQRPTGNHCRMRLTGDVSAVADPYTGLAVYDTYGLDDDDGWLQVGGTSLSTPLVAAMVVRAGRTGSYDDASGLYQRAASFHDVVGGRNGFCGGDYLCTGVVGYDGPSGVGTPDGLTGL